MSYHLGLDLDLVELLARVDADDAADHLGHDNHVPQVRLDQVGLLVGLGLLLRDAQLLDEAHGAALQAAVEPAPGAGMDDIAQLFGGEVEESVWKGALGFFEIWGLRGASLRWIRQLTGRGRCRGRRTCGTLSSS